MLPWRCIILRHMYCKPNVFFFFAENRVLQIIPLMNLLLTQNRRYCNLNCRNLVLLKLERPYNLKYSLAIPKWKLRDAKCYHKINKNGLLKELHSVFFVRQLQIMEKLSCPPCLAPLPITAKILNLGAGEFNNTLFGHPRLAQK